MRPCDECAERLLDYVYGLLGGSELQETREHLRSCAECQAALEQVQGEQKLMARAAKAIAHVPEFVLPSETTETIPAPVPATTKTLPGVGANPTGRRPLYQRPWIVWTIAASLFFVVAGGYSLHQYRLLGHQKELAAQRHQFREIDLAYESLPAKFEHLQKREIDKLRDGSSPYVHIVGPTQLQPNAKAQLRITTRNSDGELAACHLRIKLIEVPTGNIVQIKRLQSDRDGHALLELDASKAQPNSILQVVVEAELGNGNATVKDTIRLQPPTYVTRIDTNKVGYQIDDVLFFRVLVLDRCSLQPPAQPILVRVELKNPKDEVVARLDAPTSEGGILAREFPIAQSFLAGLYTLSVTPLDPAQTLVQSAMQKLEVVRDLRPPEIQLDQNRYAAGDKITGTVRGAMPKRAMGTFGKAPPVPVTIEPQLGGFGGGGALPGAAFGGGSGGPGGGGFPPSPNLAKGGASQSANTSNVQRFSAELPKQLPEGERFVPFKLEFDDAQGKQEFNGVVPIGPTDYDIDFFPEGGDLIAGVLNRVYYRVRSRDGEPVTGDGRVILMTGQNEFVDSRYTLGLGYLDFTPNTKETYTARITTPDKTSEIAQPFTKLGGIRPMGVVLHIPSAVGKQGDAIRLTLRNQGPSRKLLLAAHCRGQIVDQRWVDVKTGSQDFTLLPAPDARGMVKVTAYEVNANDTLLPVAERLVYRTPVQRLELAVRYNTLNYEPGKNVQLGISARTELGESATGWMLASVVDERFQPRTRSLSAHFLLLNEIRTGSELEDAQVVLHDSPESTAMLERFLGTHGWRRFLHRGESAQPAKNDVASMVFSRESMSLEQLQKASEAKYAAALDPLRKAAFIEEANLRSQRAHLSGMVLLAENQVQQFEEATQIAIRLSLGALGLILLLAALILMAIGVYRLVKQYQSATPSFAGAFGCLAACLLVMFGGSMLGPIEMRPVDADNLQFAMNRKVEEKLNAGLTQDPVQRGVAEPTSPVGAFAVREPKQTVDMAMTASVGKKSAEHLTNQSAKALHDPRLAQLARIDKLDRMGEDGKLQQWNNQTPASKKFFDAAKSLLTKPAAETLPQVAPMPKLKGKGGSPPAVPALPKAPNDEVEYAFKFAPKTMADTLLWNPRLLLVNGDASASFDIASGHASYRILLLAHTPSGRFGFLEARLDAHGVGQ